MRRRALLVAVQRFDDRALATLRKPEADVLSLSRVLRDPALAGFEVSELIDPTLTAFRTAVFDLFDGSRKDDLLLLYYAGHGILDDYGNLYLTARDTEKRRFRASGLDTQFVAREMGYAGAKRQLIVLDCCHSGAFAAGRRGSPPDLGKQLQAGGGRVVITSCDATQYAWEDDKTIGDLPTSPFASLLIEGLRTGAADTDGDGVVSVTELFDHVARGLHGTRQRPNIWISDGVGDFALTTNAHAGARGSASDAPARPGRDWWSIVLIGLQRAQNEALWFARRYRALLAGGLLLILTSGWAYAERDWLQSVFIGPDIAISAAEEREAREIAFRTVQLYGAGEVEQLYRTHLSTALKSKFTLQQAVELGRNFRETYGFGAVNSREEVRIVGAQAASRLPTGEHGRFYSLSLRVQTDQRVFLGAVVLEREGGAWKVNSFQFMPDPTAPPAAGR